MIRKFRPIHNLKVVNQINIRSNMKFSMLAVAATMLAGASGFGVSPSFAIRQVGSSCRWFDDDCG
jgi:hypothetical protein